MRPLSSRKDELAAMSGSDMNEYYKRFKAVREYHRAFANMPVASLDSEIADAGQDRSATIERACLSRARALLVGDR